MLLPRPPCRTHAHRSGGQLVGKLSPWGWSHMQSHMQERATPKPHNRHGQAENSIGGCSDTRGLSCVPPSSTTRAGAMLQGRVSCFCHQTCVLFRCWGTGEGSLPTEAPHSSLGGQITHSIPFSEPAVFQICSSE